MKQFLIGLISMLALTTATPAMSQHHGMRGHPGFAHNHYAHRHHMHRYWHPGYGWVLPAVIGGTVVYAATRPSTVVVQPTTTVIESNQVVIDGVMYEKQIMVINGVAQEVLVKVIVQKTFE